MLHSHLEKPYTVTKLRVAKRVSDMIDAKMREHGVDHLYTWGITDQQDKYNRFLGYEQTDREVTLNGLRTNPSTYEYVKEL